jgi:hypothetical protein
MSTNKRGTPKKGAGIAIGVAIGVGVAIAIGVALEAVFRKKREKIDG